MFLLLLALTSATIASVTIKMIASTILMMRAFLNAGTAAITIATITATTAIFR